MRVPFAAYEGREPFVFVCYAHDDAADVYAELEALRAAGLRLWYDEGITPGSEWSEALAERIRECGAFLYFVSERSIHSPHCRREVNFALDQGCAIRVVHLEPVELPDGLKLSLSNRQAILRYRYAEPEYRERVARALHHAVAAGALPDPVDGIQPQPPRQVVPGSRTRAWRRPAALGLLAAGAVAVAVAVWWMGRMEPSVVPATEVVAATDPGSASAGAEAGVGAPVRVTVRPFAADPEVAVGLAEAAVEELIVQLGAIRSLGLAPAEAPDTYVLAGRIAGNGDSVRITVRLNAPGDGELLWTQRFEQPAGHRGLVAAQQIAHLVEGIAGTHAFTGILVDVDARARREYLLGFIEHHRWLLGAGGQLALAADHYRRAVAIEPGFVVAQSFLVLAHGERLGQQGLLADYLPEVHDALRTMLTLLREAPPASREHPHYRFVAAWVLLALDLDYEAAERFYVRTLELGMSRGLIGWGLGAIHLARGDFEEAIRQLELAAQAGTGGDQINNFLSLGTARMALGQYPRAIRDLERAQAMALPGTDWRLMVGARLVEARFRAGDTDGAGALLDALWHEYGDVRPHEFPALLALLGRSDDARRVLETVAAGYPASGFVLYWSTFLGHYRLGDWDSAFLWLDRVIDNREYPWIGFLRRSAELDPLRQDPRWAAAVARLAAIEQAGSPLRAELASLFVWCMVKLR